MFRSLAFEYLKIRGCVLSNGHRVKFDEGSSKKGFYLVKHHVSARRFWILPFNIVIVGLKHKIN